jgi:heptaprenyl diphosphate synthase
VNPAPPSDADTVSDHADDVPTAESAAAVARMAGYEPLAAHLDEVERRLSDAVLAPPALLTESAGHLLTAGGKRVRPALALICADAMRTGDADRWPADAAVDAAVAVELVHLGSLHHDDVIDEADARRNVPTVNARWSNTVAVLSGDFLLARASQIAAALGREPAAILADTIGELATGEIIELAQLHETATPVERYYEAITGKTASLMAASCRLGALVAGADAAAVASATAFGTELGLVFQIVDDVLDLVADEERTGKMRGIDLYEGVYTLPTLLALRNDGEGALRDVLVPSPSPDQVERAIELVIGLGGVAEAVDRAATHLATCDSLQARFPDGPAVGALERLSRYVLERVTTET